MELHPVLARFLTQPADPDEVPVERQSPAAARAQLARELAALDAPKPSVWRVTDAQVKGAAGNIGMRIYEPHDGTARPALIYFHGGGYIRGSLDTHDSSCRILANSSGCVVFSVDYRLAPEAKFPAPLEDCYAATVEIVARAGAFGVDPARIAIGGDSAGGNFTAGVTLLARQRGGPALRFQLLIYPNLDMGVETESIRLYSKGYFLDSMPFYIASYTNGAGDFDNPLCCPLRATDLSNLPPALILTCGYDPLRDEGLAYASRLRAAGVPVEEIRHDDMIHGFFLMRGMLPEADAALAACGLAVGRALGAVAA